MLNNPLWPCFICHEKGDHSLAWCHHWEPEVLLLMSRVSREETAPFEECGLCGSRSLFCGHRDRDLVLHYRPVLQGVDEPTAALAPAAKPPVQKLSLPVMVPLKRKPPSLARGRMKWDDDYFGVRVSAGSSLGRLK